MNNYIHKIIKYHLEFIKTSYDKQILKNIKSILLILCSENNTYVYLNLLCGLENDYYIKLKPTKLKNNKQCINIFNNNYVQYINNNNKWDLFISLENTKWNDINNEKIYEIINIFIKTCIETLIKHYPEVLIVPDYIIYHNNDNLLISIDADKQYYPTEYIILPIAVFIRLTIECDFI